MLFYIPLLQKSLVDFDILDAEAVRSRKLLSNFWVMQRDFLGNPKVMFVIWFFFCCVFSGLNIYYGLNCTWMCLEKNYYPAYSLVNDVAAGCVVIFGLSMLCVQKLFT